jgi:uncharacterized protein involved in response to NO
MPPVCALRLTAGRCGERHAPIILMNSQHPHHIPRCSVLCALGFRPFFLLAGISAVLLIGLWLLNFNHEYILANQYGPAIWHSHEMLFGYTTAVIAGFLLTAVRNWTGINTLNHGPLAGLATLWLAGRVLPLAPPELIFPPIVSLVDIAFLPALTIALGRPLMRGKQKVNRIFLPLLATMAIANLLVHLQVQGVAETAGFGTKLMLYLVILLIAIIVGRVLPFFTEAALPGVSVRRSAYLEQLSFSVLILLLLTELFYPEPWMVIVLTAVTALTQAVRLSGWYRNRIWGIPILWVLYTGYFWLIAGFALLGCSAAGLVAGNLAVHAFTVGAIAVLTLGMMARVSLGHTARPMRASPLTTIGFVLLNLAVMARVIGPIARPAWYAQWITLSGGLWISSFLLFTVVYAPILTRPRIDGRPG